MTTMNATGPTTISGQHAAACVSSHLPSEISQAVMVLRATLENHPYMLDSHPAIAADLYHARRRAAR
jgi:hypothetical protein